MLEHQLMKKQSKKSPAEGIPGYTNEKKKAIDLDPPIVSPELVGTASLKADRRLSPELNPVRSDFLIGSGYRSARAA